MQASRRDFAMMIRHLITLNDTGESTGHVKRTLELR